MAIVEGADKVISLLPQNRFGYSQDFGSSFYGFVQFGESNSYSGIWQRKKTKKGWRVSRQAFYWPTNPRTPAQQSRRGRFAEGVSAWQSLTEEQKRVYNGRAEKRRFSGFNLFMHFYMQG